MRNRMSKRERERESGMRKQENTEVRVCVRE